MRKTTLAGALALSLLSLNIHALSVGNMQVDSRLGEPLDISIDLNSIDENEYSTLEVKLATREMFTLAGIEYPENAGRLEVSLGEYDNGKAQINVKTSSAVSDPFVHLLLSINWSGGNILREYTALIDPVDYTLEPLAEATSPESSMGITRSAEATSNGADERFHTVKKGDTLSAIAALYRPTDVSIQQAWMAFFNLNRDAFHDSNLNYLEQGARLKVPGEAELRAMSRDKAITEVRRLARPLEGTSGSDTPAPKGPTLVVGGKGNKAPVQKPAASEEDQVLDNSQLGDAKGYDQLASIVTEMSEFTETIKQEINSSRDRDALLKEELIAARGENRVLTERMARLEAQLSRMSELLELQGNALQAMSGAGSAATQAAPTGLALDQLEPETPTPSTSPGEAETRAAAKPGEAETPTQAAPAVPESATDTGQGDTPKSYYEQLLDEAISDAPQEDLSYIEEVLGQSSTSIGLQDANPVTPEMQARAAAARPAAPASASQETADMLANVRASLGNLSGATGTEGDVEIAEQDIAYLDALNQEDRSQIQKSEAKIAQLEKELQARIRAAQGQAPAPATAPETTTDTATDVKPAEKPAEPTGQKPTRVAAKQADTDSAQSAGMMDNVSNQFERIGQSVGDSLGGITSDVWRLIGGLGAAVIGLMVILGLRRRKTEPEENMTRPESASMPIGNEDSSQEDVGDLATKSLQQEPEEDIDEEELHGSSLFDLSDESFMASEAIQDDSSLFSMDENEDMDSLTEMDSEQLDGPSTMTQTVDVDPVAEADVYLAYDRKEQAIDVLEQALTKNPNQSAVVIKLLGLYRDGENSKAFTRLFESSAEYIEDDNEWNSIKTMAQEFVPGHEMLADDFDSSIPVLNDEIVADTHPLPDMDEAASSPQGDLELEDTDDGGGLELTDTEGLAPLKTEEEDDVVDDESLNLILSDDESASIELEKEIDNAVEEVNQHEPDTALALAKAYIELGETDIARDFLQDVINGDSDELKNEAEEMLKALG